MVYDLSKLNSQNNGGELPPEEIELYPSELNEIKFVAAQLQKKYGFKQMNDATRTSFTNEVEGEFERIGLRARVTWTVDVSGDSDTNLFHVPTISVIGRTEREKETDFDRMKRETVAGEADGKVGYLREDGTRREDAIKKDL